MPDRRPTGYEQQNMARGGGAGAGVGAVMDGITYRVPEREFGQMIDTTHSSGVAAVITWSPPSWESIGEIRAERVLFCDRMADPGNLGTLIRTAAGIGLDAIVTGPDSVEITNPKTMRARRGRFFASP